MERVKIKGMKKENIEDLCQICIPLTKGNDSDWVKGAE